MSNLFVPYQIEYSFIGPRGSPGIIRSGEIGHNIIRELRKIYCCSDLSEIKSEKIQNAKQKPDFKAILVNEETWHIAAAELWWDGMKQNEIANLKNAISKYR